MRTRLQATAKRFTPPLIGLAAGTAIGFLDVNASEVQGPLLLLMVTAFGIALASGASRIAIGVAVFLGLPLAHAAAQLLGAGGSVQLAMLVAALPVIGAALAGGAVRSVLQRSARTATGLEPVIAYPAFALAIIGTALVGAPIVFATLSARHQPNAWWVAGVWQTLTVLAWTVLAPALLRFRAQGRDAGSDAGAMRAIGMHGATVAVLALVHALVLLLLSRVLFVNLGTDEWGTMARWAVAAYLPLDAITYASLLVVAVASDAKRAERAATLRETMVRGELATAELAALHAQLRPHFLFNALNAGIVLARRGDAEATAGLLEDLASLLRHVLRAHADDAGQLVPLREEVAFSRDYLEISERRFQERLAYALHVPDDLGNALVPHLLLQPLVENAVEHGIGGKLSVGSITVTARRVDGTLSIAVEDDGPGPGTLDAASTGVGLANTRRRLAVLYGASASLELRRRETGGAVATVVLPLRFAASPHG